MTLAKLSKSCLSPKDLIKEIETNAKTLKVEVTLVWLITQAIFRLTNI